MSDAPDVAERIANGHAYRKHVVARGEFPEVSDPEQFAELIRETMANADVLKPLRNGRSAYWREETGVVVIVDPAHPDGGTAFRPQTGRDYLDRT